MRREAAVAVQEAAVLQQVLLGSKCGVCGCHCVGLLLKFTPFAKGWELALSNAITQITPTIEHFVTERSGQLATTVILFGACPLLCKYCIPQFCRTNLNMCVGLLWWSGTFYGYSPIAKLHLRARTTIFVNRG